MVILEDNRDQLGRKTKKSLSVPSDIKDFDQFKKQIKDPPMSMAWFVKNKVIWPKGKEDTNNMPFHWPDDLIKEKQGNCLDQSIFMHYFMRHKKIEHRLIVMTWFADNGGCSGHIMPVYKKGNFIFVWSYLCGGTGFVAGPFRDWQEAQEHLEHFEIYIMNKGFRSPTDIVSSYVSEEDLLKLDEYYGNKDITQEQYITMNACYNFRSTHLSKIKIKNFYFWNPVLYAYDAMRFAYNTLPIRAFFNQEEESK